MANPPGGPGASSELIALTTVLPDRKQQLIVIDPRVRVMSVYHIDQVTGEITLKSVRNIHWDLQMSEFNGTSPSPREIRAMAEQYR